jgi:hypothetical protein
MKWIKRQKVVLIVCLIMMTCSCSQEESLPPLSSVYPIAVDVGKVGKYPALTKSGGGFFYDDVLEYRVWVHPGGDDYFRAFTTYEEAKWFSERTEKAEEPLVLVLQHEHINEPELGIFEHVKGDRITEWNVEWLSGGKRGPDSVANFLKQKDRRRAQPAPRP